MFLGICTVLHFWT